MQQPQQNGMTLRQKMDFAKWLMFFPALSALLFMRRNLGYRILNPAWIICICGVMVIVANWLSRETAFAEMLILYAIVLLFGGLWERMKRWRELRRGEKTHTYYIGDSQLRRLWMPQFLKRNRRVERFLDPAFCVILGFPLAKYFSPAFGGWLVFSGACLRVYEAEIYKRELQRELDLVDSMVESEVQEEVIEHYSVRIENQSGETVKGIPTGCSADIQKTILRRAKRAPRSQRQTP